MVFAHVPEGRPNKAGESKRVFIIPCAFNYSMRLKVSNLAAHSRMYLSNPKGLASDLLDFGPASAAKWLLSNLGTEVYAKIEYPIVHLKVSVQFNGTWRWVERGRIELDCIRKLAEVVKQGSTVFDVGAFHGSYTLLLSHLVGESGRVRAFEPVAAIRNVLDDNVKKNGMANVKTEPFCISNKVGEVKLFLERNVGTGSSIVGGRPGQENCILVPATTIDNYCEDNDIWPQGIKVDVEGAEACVIQGCQKAIRKCHPWILLEFHGQFFRDDERRANWDEIVRYATEVVYIEGTDSNLSFGSKLNGMPEGSYFHVFIQY